MAINRFLQSSVQSGLPKFDSVWDGRSAVGSMEPISAITLTGSQSSIQFNNIPQTYTHLQIRVMARTSSTSGSSSFYCQINSDTGANYSQHRIYGSGSSVAASGDASQTSIQLDRLANDSATSGMFGVAITDFLDYTNTNKYKTVRSLGGTDNNGSGFIMLNSGLWMNTNAITSLSFAPDAGKVFNQYSSFALYGIK